MIDINKSHFFLVKNKSRCHYIHLLLGLKVSEWYKEENGWVSWIRCSRHTPLLAFIMLTA